MDKRLTSPTVEFYSFWISAAWEYHARRPEYYPHERLDECLNVMSDKAIDA